MPINGSRPNLGLPREKRLLTSSDFAKIKLNGQRLVFGAMVANWLPNELGYSRFGVIAPAKIGKAHVRSRAKRLLREMFRLHQHEFVLPVDLVLVARNSIVGKTFSEVEENFLTILKRARLLRQK